jgi:hypothetical protein
MQYTAQDGTLIDLEKWVWVVTYRDGSQHYQFDSSNGKYNNFASIDLASVAKITMLCPENGKTYTVEVPKGATLVHRYDNIIQQPLGGQMVKYRLYCFGYETEDSKKLFTILPTDVVIHGEVENIDIL